MLLGSVYNVSIHAPAWGATSWQTIGNCKAKVSIHAPAWGATRESGSLRGREACFNPRARVGRDRRWRQKKINVQKFQSTRPRGARLQDERNGERD